MNTSAEGFFAYHPKRIFWYGFTLLSVLTAVFVASVLALQPDETVRLSESKRVKELFKKEPALSFSLTDQRAKKWLCPIPDLQDQIVFSLDPPRPDAANQSCRVSVRLKERSISQGFQVPCQIHLSYREGSLDFEPRTSSSSPFYLELLRQQGVLWGKVVVDGEGGEPFRVFLEDPPVQTAQEFSENSPFRSLALGKWWGVDLFYQTHIEKVKRHRIDLGSLLEAQILDAKEGGWLAFLEGRWREVNQPLDAKNGCIARIISASSSGLLMEGWEADRHVRFCLPTTPVSPFKIKADDLFGWVRVRSDKQISCLLDKQCLILKIDDWVVKIADRWKILRKAEEKEAFLKGKLVGELFVLDQISNKQGQKAILGHMYNAPRTQVTSIDLPVLGRKPGSAHPQTTPETKGKVR